MDRRPALTPARLREAAPAERLRGAARALAIGTEVRSLLPEAPRRPTPEDLLFLARSVVRDAARAEFVREGLDAIDLPEDFRRADLQSANLLADRDHLAFLDRTLAVIDVRDVAPDAREAARVAHSPTSRDRCGLTLEAASVIASYLVGAAERLGGERTDMPGDHAAFVAEQALAVRDAARETLGSLVTAPQELRAARALRAAVDAGEGGATKPEAGTPPEASAADAGRTAPGGAQQTRPAVGGDGAQRARGSRPHASASDRREDRWRPSDLRRVLDHADSARAFFETDAGRGAVRAFRAGAGMLAERAAQRADRSSSSASGSGTDGDRRSRG